MWLLLAYLHQGVGPYPRAKRHVSWLLGREQGEKRTKEGLKAAEGENQTTSGDRRVVARR